RVRSRSGGGMVKGIPVALRRRRPMLKVLGATALTLALLGLSHSQEKPDDKTPAKPRPKLPSFYKKLSLSEEQREKIFKIRAEARKKVEALQVEIGKIQAKERADNEAVLTPEQRKLLQEIRSGFKAPSEKPNEPAKARPK